MRRPITMALILFTSGCQTEERATADGPTGDSVASAALRAVDTLDRQPRVNGPTSIFPIDTLNPDTATRAGTWTAGATRVERPEVGMTTATSMRIARHDGFERVVLEMAGDTLPGYWIEYIDKPVRQCGSGHTVQIAGDGWLQIRLEPARAHTEQGQATIGERERRPAQPIIREAVMTCDFEAHLEWVIGVSIPNRYRVFELKAPARLVVDIRSE